MWTVSLNISKHLGIFNYVKIVLFMREVSMTLEGKEMVFTWITWAELEGANLEQGKTTGFLYKVPNFMRDKFTSNALQVNLVSRNIKRNMLKYISWTNYLILNSNANTIAYLEVIKSPVEYQNILWDVWETRPIRASMLAVFGQFWNITRGIIAKYHYKSCYYLH